MMPCSNNMQHDIDDTCDERDASVYTTHTCKVAPGGNKWLSNSLSSLAELSASSCVWKDMANPSTNALLIPYVLELTLLYSNALVSVLRL